MGVLKIINKNRNYSSIKFTDRHDEWLQRPNVMYNLFPHMFVQ